MFIDNMRRVCYNKTEPKEKESKTMRTIFFDMDGTITDLYGVEGWLDMLRSSNPTPYRIAKPLVNLSALARILNKLQKRGFRIGIISWLSKGGTIEYNEAVTTTKVAWLKKHLPSVKWDEINIVNYGMVKETFSTNTEDILFDDEDKNRTNWTGVAYDVNEILQTLKSL